MANAGGDTRRRFLKAVGAVAAGLALPRGGQAADAAAPAPAAQTALPRWRGFNLVDFFQAFSRGEEGAGMVAEDDLRWIRDWGFDYIRLPMDYWLWIDADWRQTRKLSPDDMNKINEGALAKVDRAVELCRKHGLHVTLNFHRAPGYCINDPGREPFVLWRDQAAEDAFLFHWELFAKRYKGESRKDVSFNLVNEAPSPRAGYMTHEDYARVMTRATERIRAISPDRVIIVDGLEVGNKVVEELAPLGVAQSVHAYHPGRLTHYRAGWVDRNSSFPMPSWPLLKADGSVELDRKGLERHYAPWAELARRGIGVHCGECGCYNKTPYSVFTAWMRDVLEILKGHGIGWALWNFRGTFGILNSGRTDIAYEAWKGHKLDRELLRLLQGH